MRDYTEGPTTSCRAHYEDWVRHVERITHSGAEAFVKQLMAIGYSIHFHVWTQVEIVELFLQLRTWIALQLEIELVTRNLNEVIVVLRKT